MDNQQPNQPTDPAAPQIPATQPIHAQPPVQIKQKSGLKTAGGAVTLIFGVLTILTGLLQATVSLFMGIIILGLGIFWLVMGALILGSSIPAKSAKLLQTAGATAVAYTGILFFGAFFLPVFKFSAVLLPLIFTVALAVLSSRYAQYAKSR